MDLLQHVIGNQSLEEGWQMIQERSVRRLAVWVLVGLVVAMAATSIMSRKRVQMPDAAEGLGLKGHPLDGGGDRGGELLSRAEIAERFKRRVAEPDPSLREELLGEVKRLMDLFVGTSFDDYARFRQEMGLPKLPDEPCRVNHALVSEHLRKLAFHWDRSEVMIVREGKRARMLIHDGMAFVDFPQPNRHLSDLITVPVPDDSFRIVCRVPVTFPEETDGVTSGVYYIYLSNSLPSGRWVVYKLGISSGESRYEAWQKYVGPIF